MNFKTLLLISAILTATTFVVLIIAPTSIPGAFGIRLNPSQYLLSYLIGGNDLAIAFLSLAGRKIKDIGSLKVVAWFLMIFHAQVGLICVFVLAQGIHLNLIGNIIFRAIACGLFYYYGIYKLPHPQKISNTLTSN